MAKGSDWPAVMDVIERRLGWTPQGDRFRGRAVEMAKLQRAAKQNPTVTPANLRLAVEFCVRNRIHVEAPYSLISLIPRALELANVEPAMSDLDTRVQAALDVEYAQLGPESEYWIGRLTRASGDGREEVLAEWTERHD